MKFNLKIDNNEKSKIGTSNWAKFCLLLWKNWKLQWNHKIQLVVEILLPVVFTLLLVVIRALVNPEYIKEPTLNSIEPITGIDYVLNSWAINYTASPILKMELAYSPNNDYLKFIMQNAAKKLHKDLGGNKTVTIKSKKNGIALEKYVMEAKPIAAIEFIDDYSSLTDYPKKLSFKIRFPSELRLTTKENVHTWDTGLLFPKFDLGGPRVNGSSPSYQEEGFLAVQDAISMGFIELVKNSKNPKLDALPTIVMHKTPYPPYINDLMIYGLQQFVPLIILLSFSYPSSQTVKYITTEKEKQLKEVMKIMGLPNWLHWTAWFIKSFILMGIAICIMTIFLKVSWNSNVAVLTHADWSIVLVFLLVYTISTITFCFMLSAFFARANTAAAMCGLLWFAMYIPFSLTLASYSTMELISKLLVCLFSNSGMGYAFMLILKFEGTGEGLQWSNLFRPVNIDDDLSVGLIMVMLLVASFIYMIITLYFEKVRPGDYGIPEKWYFPFTLYFWKNCFGIHDVVQMDGNDPNLNRNQEFFEKEPVGKHVGLSISNLNKSFGKKKTVKNLSLNLYEDEVTVLLGHNGAGKTTTISMLTGMIPSTSGSVILNGYDIKKDLVSARASLGLCPQHNILFDELTVREHIVFFSRLKGLSGKSVEDEVQKYVQLLELDQKINTQSQKLSGGMKRKLSIGAALCGGSKVILCDEPSSGMDPAARRSLWDLIQSEKKGRTILLTTHFMDEADVLGDRIAIMGAGRLKCYGTSFFLKKKFGYGYRLICVKKENCDTEQVTNLLKKYIPDINIESEIGTELAYELPDELSQKFEGMLSELEKDSNKLNINGYGISVTTLEEVFMRIGAEKHDRKSVTNGDKNGTHDGFITATNKHDVEFNKGNIQLLKGNKLILSQWHAMFLKKILYILRNVVVLCIQNVMPIFFVTITIVVIRLSEFYNPLNSLFINLKTYGKSTTIVSSNVTTAFEINIVKGFEDYIESLGTDHELISIGTDFSSFFIELGKEMLVIVNSRYLVGASVIPGKVIAWFNHQAVHTAPISLNVAHNAFIRSLFGNEYAIEVTNDPLPFSVDTKLQAISNNGSASSQMAINLSFCLSFVSSFYILFVIKERVSRAKLLQFVSGVRILIFWFSQFFVDMITFTVTALITVITLACYQEGGFQNFGELGRIFLVLILFGLAVLPATYLIAMIFTEPVTGFSRLSIINIFSGMALFVVTFVLKSIGSTREVGKTLHYVFLLFPHYSLATGINGVSQISIQESQCLKVCDYVTLPFCSIELICKLQPDNCCPTDYFAWEEPGILANVVFMIISFVLYFTMLLIKEFRLVDELFYKMDEALDKPPTSHTFEDPDIDDDVKNEKLRIQNMPKSEFQLESLVLKSVSKYYNKFMAVNQVSFGIKEAECFGLLGVNGAGKTTTFKMMTGDERISYGEAFIKGMELKNNMNKIYQEIGYCPQFDALLEDLTGEETLTMFALLRGVPKEHIKELIDEMSISFGFEKHIKKAIKEYSGGNKRKLSTAIALLGSPSVIFLDEPTTGMDPAARRQLWDMVSRMRESGKAVILTSHSMEECEALCTRLVIMVNGQLKCLGSTQHLKNKFSKGLVLKIKVNKQEENHISFEQSQRLSVTSFQADIERIKQFVEKEFPKAVLQEQYQGILTFYIPLISIKWSKIFGLMERNKENLKIEDYSISQTTLEQIFLEFAKAQREDTRRNQ